MSAEKSPFVRSMARSVCDALYLSRGGTELVNWASPRCPQIIDIKSVTKSVVSMVIGRLVSLELLRDVDIPIAPFFARDERTHITGITIRHLMSHTSGLVSLSAEQVETAAEGTKAALYAGTEDPPGSRFVYSNSSVNLLSYVVEALSGRRMDIFCAEELFQPLHIDEWRWQLDRNNQPYAMSGCELSAPGLAKLGALMAGAGVWRDRRLLTEQWVAESTRPASPSLPGDPQRFQLAHGLLWWLLYDPAMPSLTLDESVFEAWRLGNPSVGGDYANRFGQLAERLFANTELLEAVRRQLGPMYPGHSPEQVIEEWHTNTWRRGLPDGRRVEGTHVGFYAQGSLGQYLIVRPDSGDVIVQLVDEGARPATVVELVEAASRS